MPTELKLNTFAEAAALEQRPRVDFKTISWRNFRRDSCWEQIPRWRNVIARDFLDFQWHEKNAICSSQSLAAVLEKLVSPEFIADVEAGLRRAPMSLRLSPYIVSLIDWSDPYQDPLRRQFLPVSSEQEPDHPLLCFDSNNEQEDSPVSGMVHRYFDRVLFLTTDICPVYCRFCTRSYAVGLNTEELSKLSFGISKARWETALQYIEDRVEVEDVVISGGDVYRLRPEHVRFIGSRLLDIGHVRRIRFATKGIAVQPMKILTDKDWVSALTAVADRGRKLRKEVSIHTHFNHPNEITGITEEAMGMLFNRGIIVRNLSVILRGVNDAITTQIELVRCLSNINIRPYYTYICDMVKGIEDLRTPLWQCVQIEKGTRGATSGHNTPTFVLDAPGGGGKRDLHSHEHYDRETGLSVYSAPAVKPGQLFVYSDPLRDLKPEVRQAWGNPRLKDEMVQSALAAARLAMAT
jgi:lysine 2,3-aminomutase